MASLAEVARKAGVSKSTASAVLSPSERSPTVGPERLEKVWAAARELSYVPNYHARIMRTQRSEIVCFAVDTGINELWGAHGRFANRFFSHLLGGVELEAASNNYGMTILGSTYDESFHQRAVRALRQRQVDGLVIPCIDRTDTSWFHSIEQDHESPIVLIMPRAATTLPEIDWDEAKGIELAIRHLTDLGHREILYLGPDPGNGMIGPREGMIMRAVAQAGMRASCCHYTWDIAKRRAAGSAELFPCGLAREELDRWIDDQGKTFTAVFAYNDSTAIGACTAMIQRGWQVPRDVSVVGVDDIDAELCCPPLTTVRQPLVEMGRRATALLLEMLNEEQPIEAFRGRRIVLDAQLIERESTALCPV